MTKFIFIKKSNFDIFDSEIKNEIANVSESVVQKVIGGTDFYVVEARAEVIPTTSLRYFENKTPVEALKIIEDDAISVQTINPNLGSLRAPFSQKTANGMKLYTRATGVSHAVVVGANVLDFVVPFNTVKFNGLEIVNGKAGEKVSLKILDTPAGAISGVPNYELNQFGFDVNLPDGFYSRESNYDADLIKDLKVRIEFTAIEARNVGVNYLIHELK